MKFINILSVASIFAANVLTSPVKNNHHKGNKLNIGNVTYGGLFYDINGDIIQAHSGGIYHDDHSGVFYLYGNDFTHANTSDPFEAVNLYKSKDLVNWKFVNALVTPDSYGWNDSNGGIETGCSEFVVLERPKIYFSKHTNKYIMYSHVTDSAYNNSMVGVATSDSLENGWMFAKCYKAGGLKSWDMGLYVDDDEDSSVYLIYSSNANGKGTNGALRISKLTNDGLDIEIENVATGRGQLESPVIFKQDNKYTLMVSHTSGWASNDNVYVQADSIAELMNGSFSLFLAPEGTHTFDSQCHYAFSLSGVSGNYSNFVYMGVRYINPGLNNSEYCWTPINVTNSGVSLMDAHTWTFKNKEFVTQGSWNQEI